MQRDTRQLLRIGLAILVTGVVAALLAATVFGGLGRQGPHTNSGWLALMIAMGCLPTGTLTLALAIANWSTLKWQKASTKYSSSAMSAKTPRFVLPAAA
jgi:uncharacterized membrane protein YidH (DUF202 family)